MNKNNNLHTGKLGEQIAAGFLTKKGYHVIERNFFTRMGEIDLVAKKDGVLVFIEVKTRHEYQGDPEWQITPHKLAKVKLMAQVYITQKQPEYTDLRLDAVCIKLDSTNQPLNLKHYQNVIF